MFSKEELLISDWIYKNWSTLQNTQEVYIYGAGKACCDLLKITANKIKYKGIIVSDCSNEKNLGNLEIYNVVVLGKNEE